MTQRRFAILLAAALLVIAAAFYLSTLRNLPRDVAQGSRLFPSLAPELDTVSLIEVRKDSAAPVVTLHKRAEAWTVAQRDDYPADLGKIRRLLLSLSDAVLAEEKTSNPANYALIGVADPTAPPAAGANAAAGTEGAEVTVKAKDGDHVVIIGKPLSGGSFARRPPEAASYLIEPAVVVDTEPSRWIDPHIMDVAVRTIQRLEVEPPAGPAYSLHRTSPTEDEFALESVPPHRVALDAKALAPSAAFAGLTADDVAAAPVKPAAPGKPALATVTLTGGAVIKLIGTTEGDHHWLQIEGDAAAALDARLRGRAFEIGGYRYDAIFRPLEQLLKPIPPAQSPTAKSK